MKAIIKSFLPRPALKFVQKKRKKYSENKYFNQKFVPLKVGNFQIEVPENHLLIKLKEDQPYRDLCIGISAKFLSEKYPDASMIDIGANVGDTAALMASYCKNKLILIEASDYFYDILVRNAAQFPNKLVTKQVLIADGSEVRGSFHHWAGTASFNEGEGKLKIKSHQLSDIADEDTCFVKTDTDGYDFKILMNAMNWLTTRQPAILFENQIRNEEDLKNADELFDKLVLSGYSHFIIWDDPGFHLLSTQSIDTIKNLNRYLFKVFQSKGHKSICNYDVLCLTPKDKDVFEKVSAWYKSY